MKPSYEELVKQNEELQRKFEALAAESAQAKQVISECKSYFIAGITNQIRPTNEGYLHMICDTFLGDTKATDAALAEIRAQGVINFVPSDEFLTELIRASNRGGSPEEYRSAMRGVFAQQQRKESDQ